MRNSLIVLVVLLLAFLGYAYYRNPPACEKFLTDIGAIFASGFNTISTDSRPIISSLYPGSQPILPAPPLSPALPTSTASSFVPKPAAATNQPAAAAPALSAPSITITATPTPAVANTNVAPTAAISTAAAPVTIKPWTAPAVLPAQANWSWTTSDGTTYDDVVITALGPETVSITHSMGVAHDIPIANLSPSIQRQLGYDPVTAHAAHEETAREAAHPYYLYASRAEAQNVARRMNWPIAWMITWASYLNEENPAPDSEDDYTLRAIAHLKSHAIIVLSNGDDDLGNLPALIRDQFFVRDDGPLPNGHHFYAPKVVFTDADITKAYGRIAYSQMKAQGDAVFDEAIPAIPADAPASPAPTMAPTTAAPATP